MKKQKTILVKILSLPRDMPENAPVAKSFVGHIGEIVEVNLTPCSYNKNYDICDECGSRHATSKNNHCRTENCHGFVLFPWCNTHTCPAIGGKYMLEFIEEK